MITLVEFIGALQDWVWHPEVCQCPDLLQCIIVSSSSSAQCSVLRVVNQLALGGKECEGGWEEVGGWEVGGGGCQNQTQVTWGLLSLLLSAARVSWAIFTVIGHELARRGELNKYL